MSDGFSEAIITEIQNFPWLYDAKRPDYRDISKKINSWQQLAATLGRPAVRCKQRWKYLRDRFRREVVRRNSLGKKNTKYWIHYQRMAFIGSNLRYDESLIQCNTGGSNCSASEDICSNFSANEDICDKLSASASEGIFEMSHSQTDSRSVLTEILRAKSKIGFIGAGNMARSMVKGLIKGGKITNDRIIVSAPTDRNRHHFEELGVEFVHDNQIIVDQSMIIFLAAKPYQLKDIVSNLSWCHQNKPLILSVAAGLSINTLKQQCSPDYISICRLMPTVPIEVGMGVCGYCFPENGDQECGNELYKSFIHELFDGIAICIELNDSQIDLVAALGSGTAFMYEAIQGFTNGMVKMGLPLHIASKLTPQIAGGAAKILSTSGKHPAELRDCICSPGGMTVYGLHALEKGGLKATMTDAVEAAVLRAKEMSQENK